MALGALGSAIGVAIAGQAAIGAMPLLTMQAAGLPTAPGETILAVAVLSILTTAPLGAWLSTLVADRVLRPQQQGGLNAPLQAAP
jgi:hypothetical protein